MLFLMVSLILLSDNGNPWNTGTLFKNHENDEKLMFSKFIKNNVGDT